MNKKHALLAAALMTAACTAQGATSTYIGASFGNTEFEADNVTAITASLDTKDSGHKLLLGYNTSDNLALEFSYVDPGQTSLTGGPGDTFTVNGIAYAFLVNGSITAEGEAITLSAIYSISPGDAALSLFGRLGLAMWDSEATVSGGGISLTIEDDGTDVYYGLGAQYDITDTIGIRGEYEFYDFDGDVDMLSLGLIVGF